MTDLFVVRLDYTTKLISVRITVLNWGDVIMIVVESATDIVIVILYRSWKWKSPKR